MKITVQYTKEEALDILCTSAEGGINYWCDIIEVTRSDPDENGIRMYDTITLRLEDDPSQVFTVKWQDMEYGANTFLAFPDYQESYLRNYILEDNNDVESADAIVQSAIFGEVIYG